MIEIRNLSVTYSRMTGKDRNAAADAVKDVSLAIEKGRLFALAGESGSGKSTVLMAIPGLLPRGTKISGPGSAGAASPSFPRGP